MMYTSFSVCQEGKYGKDCNSTCKCNFENTESCDAVDGECACLTGWKGDKCTVDINECDDKTLFDCPDKSKCININGSYACECDVGNIMTSDGKCEGK